MHRYIYNVVGHGRELTNGSWTTFEKCRIGERGPVCVFRAFELKIRVHFL